MVLEENSDLGFPLTALREIKYLSILDNDNIVRIKQVLNSKRKSTHPVCVIFVLNSERKKQNEGQLLPTI